MRGTHLWFPRGQSPDERVPDPATVLHETEKTDPGVVSDSFHSPISFPWFRWLRTALGKTIQVAYWAGMTGAPFMLV